MWDLLASFAWPKLEMSNSSWILHTSIFRKMFGEHQSIEYYMILYIIVYCIAFVFLFTGFSKLSSSSVLRHFCWSISTIAGGFLKCWKMLEGFWFEAKKLATGASWWWLINRRIGTWFIWDPWGSWAILGTWFLNQHIQHKDHKAHFSLNETPPIFCLNPSHFSRYNILAALGIKPQTTNSGGLLNAPVRSFFGAGGSIEDPRMSMVCPMIRWTQNIAGTCRNLDVCRKGITTAQPFPHSWPPSDQGRVPFVHPSLWC